MQRKCAMNNEICALQCAMKKCNVQRNLNFAADYGLKTCQLEFTLLPIMYCLRSQIWMKFWKNPKKRPFANSKYTFNYISKTLPFIKGWFILDSVQTRWKFIFFHQAWEYLQPGKFSPVWQSRHGSKAEGDSAG